MKPHFLNEHFDPMVDNPENYRLGIFYFNRKDKRVDCIKAESSAWMDSQLCPSLRLLVDDRYCRVRNFCAGDGIIRIRGTLVDSGRI
jgi:hypothetical protein